MLKLLKLIATKLLKYSYRCPLSMTSYSISSREPSLEEKMQSAIALCNIDHYINLGDGPKYLGLLSASDPTNEYYWSLVKGYWREGFFVRYHDDELVKKNKQYNFSGDQISGMLEAIWARHTMVGLTEDELKILVTIWDNTLFTKPFYLFKHPYTTEVDRGWLYSTWGLGAELIGLLAFLAVGSVIFKTDNNRFKKEFEIQLKENGYLLECPDVAIWLWKIYGCAWYDEHSQMSLTCIGYAATKNEIFKKAGLFLANRYKHQPEIQAYAFKYLGASLAPFIIDMLHLYNIDDQSHISLDEKEYSSYFSLRSFNFQKMANYILDPRYRMTNEYLWEEKDTVAGATNFKNKTIDFRHLYSLVTKNEI